MNSIVNQIERLPGSHTTLGAIVADYLIGKGDTSDHRFSVTLPLAIRGYKELNWDSLGEIKTVRLSLDTSTRSVILPTDYVNYRKVGLEVRGNLYVLGHNPDMVTLVLPDDCGDPTPIQDGSRFNHEDQQATSSSFGFYFYNYNNRAGQTYSAIYGQGSGFNSYGYYKVDNGRIYFNSEFTYDTVLLEYVADNVVSGRQTIVPKMAQECLMDFIYWADIKHKKHISGGEKERARTDFKRSQGDLEQRQNPLRMEEFISAVREGWHQAVKY